jgi:hypothetical protein
VFLVEFAGAIDEYQRRARLQAPCSVIAIAVARRLRIQPFRQHTCALIDRASTPRLFLFIEWERREQPVDGSDQFGGQSLSADDRLAHGIAREKAEHGNGRARSTPNGDRCSRHKVRHCPR